MFITTAAVFDPLLGIKCRFGLAQSERGAANTDFLLRPPRDTDERLAMKELKVAIDEYKNRRVVLEFSTVQAAWHEWLDSREQAIRGDARRSPGLPKKEEWISRLHRKGHTT